MKKSKDIIHKLELLPHPEGGYFKEVYRSPLIHQGTRGERNLLTSIYFLLEQGQKSHWHRIQSDEQWHFYSGASLKICICENNQLVQYTLGPDLTKGEVPFINVPSGHWFGAFSTGEYTLVGATVSPGFDFKDFELAKREDIPMKDPLSLSLILET